MAQRTCEHCWNWRGQKPAQGEVSIGECHASPPALAPVQFMPNQFVLTGAWPACKSDDFCGKWLSAQSGERWSSYMTQQGEDAHYQRLERYMNLSGAFGGSALCPTCRKVKGPPIGRLTRDYCECVKA
jgi:hypothetical protein